MNKKHHFLFAVALLMAHTALAVHAQEAATKTLPAPQLNGSGGVSERARKSLEDPLAGVVVNRTVTVFGNDFYQYFSTVWRQKPEAEEFSISIHERPTARFGSEIWVEFRHKRMFHAFLSPARSRVKSISQQAVELVYKNISQSEVERALIHSADLGPEEL